MTGRTDFTWKDPQAARRYIEEIAGSIPLEADQLDIMMRLIGYGRNKVRSFLDIGCGNGILSSVILDAYPRARGTLLDFSDTMLAAAQEQLADHRNQLTFIKSDYGDESLHEALTEDSKTGLDVIVSRFSIHHQTDERKYQVYKEIYDLLVPGGIFINIEHVAANGETGRDLFEAYMVDHLYGSKKHNKESRTREAIVRDFKNRHHKDANIITSTETQCGWLRDIGFTDVDCYFKVFQIALIGGIKSG